MWFSQKKISCSFVDGEFEEFRNLGFRGTEGLEVDFEVTRAHVETSPLWRLLNWGLEVDLEVTRAHVETSPLWRLLN